MVPPLRKAGSASSTISHPQHTRSNQANGREPASLRRDTALISVKWLQKAEKSVNPYLSPDYISAGLGPTAGQRITQTGKIVRQFRLEPQYFAADGMLDRQYMGMKGLPGKTRQRGPGVGR